MSPWAQNPCSIYRFKSRFPRQDACSHIVYEPGSRLNVKNRLSQVWWFPCQRYDGLTTVLSLTWDPIVVRRHLYIQTHPHDLFLLGQEWASCQIRKIAGAHAPGMPGTFSPSPQVSDPDMHHGTCVTHVPWCMPGSPTIGFLWNRRRGKTFPAFPAHAQPAILRIW